jgi:hypothetical protein
LYFHAFGLLSFFVESLSGHITYNVFRLGDRGENKTHQSVGPRPKIIKSDEETASRIFALIAKPVLYAGRKIKILSERLALSPSAQ